MGLGIGIGIGMGTGMVIRMGFGMAIRMGVGMAIRISKRNGRADRMPDTSRTSWSRWCLLPHLRGSLLLCIR